MVIEADKKSGVLIRIFSFFLPSQSPHPLSRLRGGCGETRRFRQTPCASVYDGRAGDFSGDCRGEREASVCADGQVVAGIVLQHKPSAQKTRDGAADSIGRDTHFPTATATAGSPHVPPRSFRTKPRLLTYDWTKNGGQVNAMLNRIADALRLTIFYCCTVACRITWSEGVFVCESVSAVINTLKFLRGVVAFSSPLRLFPIFSSP